MPTPNRDPRKELLDAARITGPQLTEAVARAIDPEYWRALVPDFHVESPSASLEWADADASAIDRARRDILECGYFQLPAVLSTIAVRRLNAALDAVIGAGWPASFVTLYDEAWLASRAPAIRRFLEAVLGPGHRQIPNVWAHIVHPVEGASGWEPHVDGDSRRRVTVWVALSEATLDNGCMHVIPRTAATSDDVIRRFGTPGSQFSRAEVTSLLHASRALVAASGEALGWDFEVIHWGGVARAGARTRRSFSFEYIADATPPGAEDGVPLPMDALPSFEDRLRSVAAAVLSYQKFEPVIDRFAGVARAILARA